MDHSIPSPESADSFRSCYSSFRSYTQGNLQIKEIPSDQIGSGSSSSSNRSLLHSESYYWHDPYMFDNMQIEEIPSSFGSDSSISRISSRGSEASFSKVDALTEELVKLSGIVWDMWDINRSNGVGEDVISSGSVDRWLDSVFDRIAHDRTLQKGGRAKWLSFFPWRRKIAAPDQPKKSFLELKSEGKILVNALRCILVAHEDMLVILESVKNHSRIGIISEDSNIRLMTRILKGLLASENSVTNVFDLVIWLTISYAYGIPTARRIQDDVATRLNLSLDVNDSTKARATALFDALSKIRFLLVLDSLQGLMDLSTIGIPHCNAHNQCVMVITSSPKEVCEAMGASKIFEAPRFCKEDF